MGGFWHTPMSPHWFPLHDLSALLALQAAEGLPHVAISGAKTPPRDCLPSGLHPYARATCSWGLSFYSARHRAGAQMSAMPSWVPFPNTAGPSHIPKGLGAQSSHLSLMTFARFRDHLAAITGRRVQGLFKFLSRKLPVLAGGSLCQDQTQRIICSGKGQTGGGTAMVEKQAGPAGREGAPGRRRE